MLIIERSINRLNSTTGHFISYMTVPLILVVVYEVFMRYAFNSPTVWAFEATTLMYGIHFVLGFAYTHQKNGHVAIDVFESKLPAKPRTLLRLAVNLIIFIPTIGLMAFHSIRYAATSWDALERASTSWAPPLYPFKGIMALGFVLLFLQGVAKLIEDFNSLGKREEESAE